MALVKHIFKHTSRAMYGQKLVTGASTDICKKDKKDLTDLDSNYFSYFIKLETASAS